MTWNEVKARWIPSGPISLWFVVYFFTGAFIMTGVPIIFEYRRHGGTLAEAYSAVPERIARTGLTPTEIGLAVLFWAGLLWIAFSSNYKRVTENDKRLVRLWTAAMVALELIHLARHIIGTS